MDSEATQEIKRHFDVVAESLRMEVRELRAEIQDVRRHSDVMAESLRSEIRIVAEGITGLDEKFTQEFRNVRQEFREAIGEVKSLLRLSYGDLDRRVRTLEDAKPS
jgi:predicted secreted Zn-dependent protease